MSVRVYLEERHLVKTTFYGPNHSKELITKVSIRPDIIMWMEHYNMGLFMDDRDENGNLIAYKDFPDQDVAANFREHFFT